MGPFVFGNPAARSNPKSNRSYLLELCTACDLVIGNTLFDEDASRQITCYNVGSQPMDVPTSANFGQIDFALISREWTSRLRWVHNNRTTTLASHHFIVLVHLQASIPKPPNIKRPSRLCHSALRDASVADHFARTFDGAMRNSSTEKDTITLDDLNAKIGDAMQTAANQTLPRARATAKRPWVSSRTLHLIDERSAARAAGNHSREKDLHKGIRTSVQ